MANVSGTGGGTAGVGGGTAAGGSAAGGAAAGGAAGPCSTDANCAPTDTCNPVTRQCIPSCTTSSDCPNTAKTCATSDGMAPGTGGRRGFCQCATDALCALGTPGDVCQPATRQCGAPCTATSQCPLGSTCTPATGRCNIVSADAGMTACVPGSCGATQICDPLTQRCSARTSCVQQNPQPDTCTYGLVCGATGCGEAPRTGVGCQNFSSLATPTAWDPATATPRGPVTWSFQSIGKDTGSPLFCGARGADFSAEANLYAGSTNFPSTFDLLPAGLLNYVRTDGQIIDLATAGFVRPSSGYASGLSNGNKNLRLRFNLCVSGTVPATISAGFYAEGGNAMCATLQ